MSLASISYNNEHYFQKDANFKQLYPASIQQFDKAHWSPIAIVRRAVDFLADKPGVSILDIGSGVGKFCLVGAGFQPAAIFYGVEQRKHLVDHAESAREKLKLRNAHFIHKNFTQLDLKLYDHFYFYNAFYENIEDADRIDESIAYSVELYNYYSHYLNKQLDVMPRGTRIVTYCSWDDEIPPGYRLIENHNQGLLKYWVKT